MGQFRCLVSRSPSRKHRSLREGDELRVMARAIRQGLSLLCVLGLVGCALPGSTSPVLKIGLVAPFEGWYRHRGYDALWAVRLAVQEANRAGGVAGWQVELTALDDHLDPYWTAQRVRELAVDPDVMGAVGCLSPTTAEAARGVCSEVGLPLVALASVEARGGGLFVIAPGPDALAEAASDFIRMQGAGRVAVLYDGGEEEWASALRRRMEVAVYIDLSAPGWLEDVTATRPDWVICAADVARGAEGLRLARGCGLQVPFMGGPAWGTEALIKVAGDAARNTWFVTGTPRGKGLEEADRFLRAYSGLAGHDPGPDAVLAYDATRALLAALATAIEDRGYPTRQGTREALGGSSLQGVTGPIRFDPMGARRNVSVWVYAVK